MYVALRATFGRANRLSYRFVMARFAALVPKPRANLTRFHGALAPNSKQRIYVTPAKRGKGSNTQDLKSKKNAEPPVNEHKEMTWAQRLKGVFTNSRRF